MIRDKFSAVWVSHSSIRDYVQCPRAYYLGNVYKDPKTNRKIAIMSPAMALGQVVHEVIESLSNVPTSERFAISLTKAFEREWEKISGDRGGFKDIDQEKEYKQRGLDMLQRVEAHPGPLLNKTIKIRKELPYFWLSDDENIILCGKIDWLEYLEDTDSVHIIDFKTGKYEEDEESLQLPIYVLLAQECQSREVSKVSYWYLAKENTPYQVPFPDIEKAQLTILELAKRISTARKLQKFTCRRDEGMCFACRPYERVLQGEATYVGTGQYGQDIYILRD